MRLSEKPNATAECVSGSSLDQCGAYYPVVSYFRRVSALGRQCYIAVVFIRLPLPASVSHHWFVAPRCFREVGQQPQQIVGSSEKSKQDLPRRGPVPRVPFYPPPSGGVVNFIRHEPFRGQRLRSDARLGHFRAERRVPDARPGVCRSGMLGSDARDGCFRAAGRGTGTRRGHFRWRMRASDAGRAAAGISMRGRVIAADEERGGGKKPGTWNTSRHAARVAQKNRRKLC